MSGPGELVLVSVSAPCEGEQRSHVTVRYGDGRVAPAEVEDALALDDHGVKIAEGTFEKVATDPKVVEAYLGLGGTDRT